MNAIPSWANLVIGLVMLVPLALALAKLMTSKMTDAARLFWAIVIVFVPVMGPVAFLLFKGQTPDANRLA